VTVENNDLMRRVRYALQLDDEEAARLVTRGGLSATESDAAAWRAREEEPAHAPCPDAALIALLEAFVLERRGPPPEPTPPRAERSSATSSPITARLTNNHVLKQLRIALELRASDVQALVGAGGGTLGTGEIGALFRKPGTRNYRSCGDQVLRQFLAALAARREG